MGPFCSSEGTNLLHNGLASETINPIGCLRKAKATPTAFKGSTDPVLILTVPNLMHWTSNLLHLPEKDFPAPSSQHHGCLSSPAASPTS